MKRIVFRGANLLDGRSPARPNTTVIIEEERIVEVTGDEETAPNPEDRVIELAGKTLMPGMYSCHFHATYKDITLQPVPLGVEYPAGYQALHAANAVRRALRSGFTGIVGAAGGYDIDAQLKLAIQDGLIEGPRILAGSRALSSTGDYNDVEKWWWDLGNKGAQRFCDGPDEFRKAVRDEIRRGAEIIKIFPSGGHGIAEPDVTMGISREELHAIVQAAHERGKSVRAHCAWKAALLECLSAGVDVIDHADRMDAECIERMVRAGTFLAPTMYFIKQLLADPENRAQARGEQIGPIVRDFENMHRMVPEANAAGVKIVIGDDYGTILLPHRDGVYAEELEFYVKSVGIAPLDVIRWATANGAALMGMKEQLGTVEEGKLADLLVVNGDPSVDIAVLQDTDNLLAILKGGEFVKDTLSRAISGPQA